MARNHKRERRGDEGQAMVELALVLPLLLILLLGLLDFGKAINYWIDENHLAAEGARLAAVSGSNVLTSSEPCLNGSSASTVAQYIQCQADTSELLNGGTSEVPNKAKVCITPLVGADGKTGAIGDPIKVNVTVDYNWLPSLNNLLQTFSKLPAGQRALTAVTLAGSATMRLENTWISGAVCYP